MPKKRNTGQFGRPTYNQAAKVIARFGSEARLAKAIGISRISCFRWQYKRPIGSDGLIPTVQIAKIKAVARTWGILIRDEDWVPEVNKWDDESGELVKATRKGKTLAELLS